MKNSLVIAVLIGLVGCGIESNGEDEKNSAQKALTVAAEKEVKQQASQIEKRADNRPKTSDLNDETEAVKSRDKDFVKVFVKGKDIKTCMRLLNYDEVNEVVIACSSDRYVLLRKDEIDKIKKED